MSALQSRSRVCHHENTLSQDPALQLPLQSDLLRQPPGSRNTGTQHRRMSYCQKLWIGRSGNRVVDGRKEESVSSG